MDFFVFCLLVISFSIFYEANGKFCPDVKIMADFDPAKITGVWYSFAYTDQNIVNDARCINDHYQVINENTTRVELYGIYTTDGKPFHMAAVLLRTPEPQVYLDILLESALTAYSIDLVSPIGTDYETYVIAYHCDEKTQKQHSWISTIERNPSESVLREIEKIISGNGIDFGIYGLIDQTDCPN